MIMSPEEQALQNTVQELQRERDHFASELQNVAAQLQRAPEDVQKAYTNGYAKRQQEDFVKDEELKNRVAKGMQDIMLELRMQGCSNHVRAFGGESSEKFQSWLQDVERNLALVGHDDARARALVLQTLTGPAADFATREIKQNPEISWTDLKNKLDARYNDMADLTFARQKLRRIAQAKGESVQNYHERLMINAAHAYGEGQLNESFVQLQLVEIFVDGLADDHMVRRLIRLRPSTLAAALQQATSEQQATKAFDLRRSGLRPGEEPMDVNTVTAGQGDLRGEVQALRSLIEKCLSPNAHLNTLPLQLSPVGSKDYVPQDLRPHLVNAPTNAGMTQRQGQTQSGPRAQTPGTHQRQPSAPGAQRSPRPITCYECQGPNHYARDCVLRAHREKQRGPRPDQKSSANQPTKNA